MCDECIFIIQEGMNIIKKLVVEFSLEQITPMVHFQGAEKAAGIRASDLKPRFDSFLKRYWYALNTADEKKKIENYILKSNETENKNKSAKEEKRTSFDYKVKIFNSCKNGDVTFYKDKKKDKDKNLFYGSLYGELEDNKSSFYERITISFLSPHQDLREKIKEMFPVFLAVNGFGLRNNKGYGYFKLEKEAKEQVLEHIRNYQELENQYVKQMRMQNKGKGVGIYKLKVENKATSKAKRAQNLLDDIKFFHQILKSGFNFKSNYSPGKYIPSFMLKKSKTEEGVILEKKALKLFLKKNKYDITKLTRGRELANDSLDANKLHYIRGLLGLASFYEFRNVGKGHQSYFTARFNVKIDGVERYASPIKYLPISDDEIIILVDYSKIEEFRKEVNKENAAVFSLNEVRGKQITQTDLEFSAQIPSEDQYSVYQLFRKDGVIERNIEDTGRNGKWQYSVISDIELG